MNTKMQSQYQGAAFLAIDLLVGDLAKYQTPNMLKLDKNGGWLQTLRKPTKMSIGGKQAYLMTIYYDSSIKPKFHKTLTYFTEDKQAAVPSTDLSKLLLLRYYWTKGAVV